MFILYRYQVSFLYYPRMRGETHTAEEQTLKFMKFGRVKIWAGFPRQSFMRQCSEMLWNRLLEIRAWRGYSISSNSGVCCRCYLCKPFCACAECNRSFRGRRSRSPPPCRSFVAIPCISDKLRERQIGKECYFYINVFYRIFVVLVCAVCCACCSCL